MDDTTLESFGLLTEEFGDSELRYDARKMIDYARSAGKNTSELTDDEREQFRIS